METILTLLAITGAAIWLTILLLPWRPWSTREVLEASSASADQDLSDITVLIPARNEADMLQTTLPALNEQGNGLHIIIVDDQSTDGTSEVARGAEGENLLIHPGKSTPSGWNGKLWALEQGRSHLRTSHVLLLDGDIEPLPGIVAELRKAMREKNVHLISLMAVLRMETFWERLLMPAFVYFFKLLYPFHLSNSSSSKVAAAAGGCILLETRVLDEIGGFSSLRGALIDDCALAKKVKSRGYKTWMGLSHSVRSLRPYNDMRAIWNMYVVMDVFSVTFLGRDPFDEFEVIAVKPDSARRYLVTYKYHHADSSNNLFAAWILSDNPELGAKEPPPGTDDPVIAWTDQENVISLNWFGDRIQAKIARKLVHDSSFLHCYFNGQILQREKRVCFNPRRVDLVESKLN